MYRVYRSIFFSFKFIILGQLRNTNHDGSDKYNFPPVSGRAGHEENCPNHHRATSCRRYSTWKNSITTSRNKRVAILSPRSGKNLSNGARSSRSAGYEGSRERTETSPYCRKTFASVSQPKQLVSKLTVHVVK